MELLWIGAHPDDELFVAPWLARLVLQSSARVHFLVLTSGERGRGLLGNIDPEQVARIREDEMRAAATLFGGEVRFARLPDGSGDEPEDVLRAWSHAAGGTRALHAHVRALVDEVRPDRIVTFNRHHGCTWHADHRATGTLVQRLALPVPLTLVESRVELLHAPLRFTRADPRAEAVDVRATWNDLVRVVACHRSQFSDEVVQRFRDVDDANRVVWLRDAGVPTAGARRRDDLARVWWRAKAWLRSRA
ncbi:MAG: PIG-L family deacetylase [Acidobacteria bacterium]|nr:PIG-L family deacetylase [Acidobacteriota bacterium]MBV9474943.1 PIG-L family deacetylase [Acidobacteriota bacterium]